MTVGIQPKPVAVFDCDGTIQRKDLLIPLIAQCVEDGVFCAEAEEEFNRLYEEYNFRRMSYEQFDRAMIDLFHRNVVGKPLHSIVSTSRRVALDRRDYLFTFTRELMECTRDSHSQVIITGAMHEVMIELTRLWGISQFYATVMESKDGVFTGDVDSLPARDKGKSLNEHLASSGDSLEGSIAIGDMSSDIPMLQMVDHPVAFNPSMGLAAEAERQGWPMVLERKDSIFVCHKHSFRRFSAVDARKAVETALHPELLADGTA